MHNFFMNLSKKVFTLKTLVWSIYIAILVVIAPHTQWMFSQWEPTSDRFVSWVAAIGFEGAIFAVTKLLVQRIERRKITTFNFDKKRLEAGRFSKYFTWWPVFKYRWLNIYTLLLLICCAISAGANLAHAVQFAQPLRIVSEWGIPESVFTVAFGGILPLVNLLFAAVIADVDDSEQAADPELEKANAALREANKTIREKDKTVQEAERRALASEQRALEFEQQMRGVANLVRFLFDREISLHDRIRGLYAERPDLPQRRLAELAGCSVSVVNEVLKTVDAE
jgi:hypothetical protein